METFFVCLRPAPRAMRGTSGTPRHTKLARYRCSLPGLAGFAGNRCTEPEVPPNGGPRCKFFLWHDRFAESSTAHTAVKGEGSWFKGAQEPRKAHSAQRDVLESDPSPCVASRAGKIVWHGFCNPWIGD